MYIYIYVICAINKDLMRFTLLRIICTTQFWCFFTAQNVQKNQMAGCALLYAHMYVCSCVCDRMHHNDSETKRLFKLYIYQSTELQTPIKLYHVGVTYARMTRRWQSAPNRITLTLFRPMNKFRFRSLVRSASLLREYATPTLTLTNRPSLWRPQFSC